MPPWRPRGELRQQGRAPRHPAPPRDARDSGRPAGRPPRAHAGSRRGARRASACRSASVGGVASTVSSARNSSFCRSRRRMTVSSRSRPSAMASRVAISSRTCSSSRPLSSCSVGGRCQVRAKPVARASTWPGVMTMRDGPAPPRPPVEDQEQQRADGEEMHQRFPPPAAAGIGCAAHARPRVAGTPGRRGTRHGKRRNSVAATTGFRPGVAWS